MGIAFNGIPANLRVPGIYIEVNNSLANNATLEQRMLCVGQRLSSGSVAAGVPTRVTSKDDGQIFFGQGAMLTAMIATMLDNNRQVELWAIALDDNPVGIAATGNIVFVGNASNTGNITAVIAGIGVTIGVNANETPQTLADNLINAINAITHLPVTAAIDGVNDFQINLTAKHKGDIGNDMIVDVLYTAAVAPTAPAITINAMAGGSLNPDSAPLIAAMGNTWYHWIAFPYTDNASLTALEAELEDRWGPMRQIGGRAFCAYRGSHSATSAFGNARNSHLVSCIGTGPSPQPAYQWAAAYCAASAANLAIDPNRQLRTIELKGILPPALADQWTDSERNISLWDGISTTTVDSAGKVRIERAITMYQLNESGIADDSYLDLTLLETQDRVRYEQRKHFLSVYPRHKLAADTKGISAGQPVTDPRRIKGELISLYRNVFVAKGWCEDADNYADSVLVEIDPDDVNRVNFKDEPNYVNQLYVVAGKQQFRK